MTILIAGLTHLSRHSFDLDLRTGASVMALSRASVRCHGVDLFRDFYCGLRADHVGLWSRAA